MIQTRIVVRPTRHVRDIYLRRKFTVVARFPGGREITKGYAQTRQRAYEKAIVVNTPQTSPTAGGTAHVPGKPYNAREDWGGYNNRVIIY